MPFGQFDVPHFSASDLNMEFPNWDDKPTVQILTGLPGLENMNHEEKEGLRNIAITVIGNVERVHANVFKGMMLQIADHFNSAVASIIAEKDVLQKQVEELEKSVKENEEGMVQALEGLQKKLDELPADVGSGSGSGPKPKMPDPPTFSGSNNKADLTDWLNKVSLYNKHMAIVSDSQRIVFALSRIDAPAAKYLRSYYDKVREDKPLGTWENFVKELQGLYGQKDEKEGAKKEMDELWKNKSMATDDFVKYSERYKTLASMLDYSDEMHIDRLNKVISEKMNTAIATATVLGGTIPKDWNAYLNMLIKLDQQFNRGKNAKPVFGTDNKNNSDNGKGKGKATETNQVSTGKQQKRCEICWNLDHKARSKTHDTKDCYEKDENKHKRPANYKAPSSSSGSNTSSSAAQGSKNKGNGGKARNPQAYKTLQARLLEMQQQLLNMEKEDDDESEVTPAGTVNVNTATLRELDEDAAEVSGMLKSGTSSSSDGLYESAKSGSTPKPRSSRISDFLNRM